MSYPLTCEQILATATAAASAKPGPIFEAVVYEVTQAVIVKRRKFYSAGKALHFCNLCLFDEVEGWRKPGLAAVIFRNNVLVRKL